jgi:SAM-dependent methyltransferase
MSESIDPRLPDYLICPNCAEELVRADTELACAGCKRRYPIRQGIPLLLPEEFDQAHLQAETTLAEMMRAPVQNAGQVFSGSQWELSKTEFWRIVAESFPTPPAAMVNIGCGYDPNFARFDRGDTLFINLDIVFAALAALRREHGARTCVLGDVTRLPLRKSVFDAVICIDVIHHEEHIADLLGSFYDLLRPGGMLFLSDPNAWGLFQFPKSIFLPRRVHQAAREVYHRLKKSTHRPAPYEFPTHPARTRAMLTRAGFEDIRFYPNQAYPNTGDPGLAIYRFLARSERIRTYHNFHYVLSARK